jgi:hypothetical protein
MGWVSEWITGRGMRAKGWLVLPNTIQDGGLN